MSIIIEMEDDNDLKERLILAGLDVLKQFGAAELTVRRIAEKAGTSTMGVYSRFGNRNVMLEAIYQRGFKLLRVSLEAIPQTSDPKLRIERLVSAYRAFALAHPALYALMFERPLVDFDPSPQKRQEGMEIAFYPLVDAVEQAYARAETVGDPQKKAHLIWSVAHGLMSIELTHAARSPLPGYFLESEADWEEIFSEGISSSLVFA